MALCFAHGNECRCCKQEWCVRRSVFCGVVLCVGMCWCVVVVCGVVVVSVAGCVVLLHVCCCMSIVEYTKL